mgnify:CR=1 FL=1
MKKPFIICIIDDDDIYQYAFKRALGNVKIQKKILTFSDGEEALDFMVDNVGNASDLPDIIFLDINMPIIDGFQFMEEYVKIKPRVGKKITIYMVSSSVNPEDLNRAKSISEISDYIVKPVEVSKLSELLVDLNKEGLL